MRTIVAASLTPAKRYVSIDDTDATSLKCEREFKRWRAFFPWRIE
jgi:hypothetical protein